MADEEPLTSASSLTKDEASDRFYKKGMEFAYSRIGGTSSSMDDDDYDEEPGATSSLSATTDQSEAVADNSHSIGHDGGVATTQAVADLTDAPLTSEPAQKADGGTKQKAATLDSHSMESQDSGIGSQTPPASVEESPLPPTSELSGTGTQQVTTDSEGDVADLPDNMSLDELHAKVKKLFPGFKPNSILRFSSLLGPGKPSSLPKLWSEAKKPPKRKKSSKPVELKLDCDFIPPDHMINTDDEVVPVNLIYLSHLSIVISISCRRASICRFRVSVRVKQAL